MTSPPLRSIKTNTLCSIFFIFVLILGWLSLEACSINAKSSEEITGDAGIPEPTVEKKPVLATVQRPISQRLCVAQPNNSAVYGQNLLWTVKKLQEAGVSWLRFEFLWHRIEKQKGKFDFSYYDRIFDQLQKHGIQFLAVLAYGVPWASSKTDKDYHYPPDDPKDFARFAKEVATHFKGKISSWEIWNEPNAGYRFWKTAARGDPVAFAALTKAAAEAIRGVESTNKIAFGGTFFHPQVIMGGIEFSQKAFAAEPKLKELLDRMAVHPYTIYPPSVAPEYGEKANLPITKILTDTAAFLPGKPLWVTEVGWPVYNKVDLQKQAEYLSRAFLLSFAMGTEVVCWYNFVDGPDFTKFPPEQAFGLFHYAKDWSKEPPKPKPAYHALKALHDVLGKTTETQRVEKELSLQKGEFGIRFSGKEHTILALWRVAEAKERTVQIPLPKGKKLEAYNFLGKKAPPKQEGDTIQVTLQTGPQYLVFR